MSDKIEVGDTVELLGSTYWKDCTVDRIVDGMGFGHGLFDGKERLEWGWHIDSCRLVSKAKDEPLRVGDYVWWTKEWDELPQDSPRRLYVIDERGRFDFGGHFRWGLTSVVDTTPLYAKCGAPEQDLRRATPEEIARVKGQGEQAEAVKSHADRQPAGGGLTPSASPCPACGGSIFGPGKIADWDDRPIACPRCQFGKPKPEPVIPKPYHKMLPSGECVVAFAYDLGCKVMPTPADELTEKLRRDQEWDRAQARKNLAKARENAKRSGVDCE